MKISKRGVLTKNIYESTDRYPLDTGECYTKKEIDDMFELSYPKGTKFVCYNEDDKDVWYLPDGDGGWIDWRKNEDDYHNLISNIKVTSKK